MIMSKKKSKKVKSTAFKSLSVLESGKLKVTEDQKISLDPFVRKNLDKVVVSRLSGIIPRNEADDGSKKKKCSCVCQLIPEMQYVKLCTMGNENSTRNKTICVSIDQKKAKDFYMLDDGILGKILRTSIFPATYKKVKKQWLELVSKPVKGDESVLYIPNVLVFLDYKTGKLLKRPFSINVLIVTRSKKKNGSDEDKKKDLESSISNILKSAAYVGAEELVINPFYSKAIKKNPYYALEYWNKAITSKDVNDNIKNIAFTIENENRYILFNNGISK